MKLNTFPNIDPEKYNIPADEYLAFNELLKSISLVLKEENFENVDLFLVDLFLFAAMDNSDTPSERNYEDNQHLDGFDHDEIRDMIESIGIALGFDIKKRSNIFSRCKSRCCLECPNWQSWSRCLCI